MDDNRAYVDGFGVPPTENFILYHNYSELSTVIDHIDQEVATVFIVLFAVTFTTYIKI